LHDYIAGTVVVRLPNKAIQRSARSAVWVVSCEAVRAPPDRRR